MNEKQRQLKLQYKERVVTGGIYRVLNKINGRYYLNKTINMESAKTWFAECCASNTCVHPRLIKAWSEFGRDAFVFEVLESWDKGADQTDAEYLSDLKELLEEWEKKLPRSDRY